MRESETTESYKGAIKSRFGAIGLLTLAGLVFSPLAAQAQNPAAPLAPLIFEKPNSQRFEVLWFHPDFHSQTFGNLATPNRYFVPFQDNRSGIIASRVSLAAPFAVYRVAAYLDTVDAPLGQLGDQYSPLGLQLTVDRESITAHPTDIEFSSPAGSATPGFVNVFPEISFPQGDSLYVGLQWSENTPYSPAMGTVSGLGTLASQETVYRTGSANQWQAPTEYFGLEIEALSWKPDTASFGTTSFGGLTSFGTQPHFVVWYAPDSTTSIAEATASAVVSSDTLSWVSALGSGGYLSVVAEDSEGALSDTVVVHVDPTSFRKITLSSPEIVFDWRRPNTLSQSIFVTNESIGPVNLRFQSDDPRVVFSETTLFLSGGAFKPVTVTMQEPPRGPLPELHSLYVFNDQSWIPLKVDMRSMPDIQTSVADDAIKPLSFELSEVYPNPNYGSAQLRIVSPQSKVFKIEVFNVLGQLLQTEERAVLGESQIAIDLAPTANQPLAAGIYFVRVSSGVESTMRKMVFVK
ncbi:T9SS type A sorting domain-containing protein [bacterium AH-315-J21]|nr:T9SS type A sorting domain-containing protein [bacterium AH-315-J21]